MMISDEQLLSLRIKVKSHIDHKSPRNWPHGNGSQKHWIGVVNSGTFLNCISPFLVSCLPLSHPMPSHWISTKFIQQAKMSRVRQQWKRKSIQFDSFNSFESFVWHFVNSLSMCASPITNNNRTLKHWIFFSFFFDLHMHIKLQAEHCSHVVNLVFCVLTPNLTHLVLSLFKT